MELEIALTWFWANIAAGDSSDEVLGKHCSGSSFFAPVWWTCIAIDLAQLDLPVPRSPNLHPESSVLKLLCL